MSVFKALGIHPSDERPAKSAAGPAMFAVGGLLLFGAFGLQQVGEPPYFAPGTHLVTIIRGGPFGTKRIHSIAGHNDPVSKELFCTAFLLIGSSLFGIGLLKDEDFTRSLLD